MNSTVTEKFALGKGLFRLPVAYREGTDFVSLGQIAIHMNGHTHSRTKSDYASLILVIAFLLACLASVKAQDNNTSSSRDVSTSTVVTGALVGNNNK